MNAVEGILVAVVLLLMACGGMSVQDGGRDDGQAQVEIVDAGPARAADGPLADCEWQGLGYTGQDCINQDQFCNPCCKSGFVAPYPAPDGADWCFRCMGWRAKELGHDPVDGCDLVSPGGDWDTPFLYERCLASLKDPQLCPFR